MSAPKTKQSNAHIIKGFLSNEKISWSKSTLATRSDISLRKIEAMIELGLSDQDIIDRAFEKTLKQERVRRRFLFRDNENVFNALNTLGVS